MKTGNLQRRWSAARPQVYDKATRVVCFDIVAEPQADESGDLKDGYSYLQVEIDRQIDYGHIKSQLIEAGFAQKDEFGLLMNAVNDLLAAAVSATDWAEYKAALETADVEAFRQFCTFRRLCAETAKEVMGYY